MRDRCRNPHNPCFNRYGWRWIKCYWENFEAFYEDMWKSYEIHCKKYWIKQTTIDRINVDWDYCKDNCRWATWKEQAKNKSKKIKI